MSHEQRPGTRACRARKTRARSGTVICDPRAEAELAEAYLQAADPGAVTSASWIIERLLRESPEAFGESRDDDLRVGFEPPLAGLPWR